MRLRSCMLLLAAAATGCLLSESRLELSESSVPDHADTEDTEGSPSSSRVSSSADAGVRASAPAADSGGEGGGAAAGPAAESGGKSGSAQPNPSNKPAAGGSNAGASSSSAGTGGAAGSGGQDKTAGVAGQAGSGGMTAPPLQFTLVDQTYTATADNTEDSHFVLELRPNIPADWTAPIDYREGQIQLNIEVLSKPSDQLTNFNLCLENASDYACLPYVPYTETGSYKLTPRFHALWQFDKVDWTRGVTKATAILKNAQEMKVQADPNFYPTKLKVEVIVMAKPAP